jgi:acetolactate synthase-1/2/3 large subunit
MSASPQLSVVPPSAPAVGLRVRVADQLVRTLHELGINTVFGVPGGAISAVYDALLDQPQIRVITSRHESSAVFAAAAHARATGMAGVVLVTSGPGVTNTITGIASCYCDGLPVVLIGGEVPRHNFGRGALQEGSAYSLNLVAMLKHVTKWSTEIRTADGAVPAIRKAISMANSGRKGPVFLSLPLDVQGEVAGVPRVALNVESRFEVDQASLNAAVQELLTARRPLILAGSGVRWERGHQGLLSVAERYQIPVATTPKAKGVFPENHPLSLGVFGHGGHPSASDYVDRGIDVLFAVGTSFGDAATNSWTDKLKAQRTSIHVDIDSSQIGRNYQVDLGLVGSASRILNALAELAPPARPARNTAGRRLLSDPELAVEGDSIKPQRALWELQQLMPTSTAYTCDIGDHMLWALHYLTINLPDAFFLSSGLAAMGSSLGAAIGCKLADRARPVVAVCGDGTLSMASSDIADAVHNRLNIVYLVLNDGRYGMVENGHTSIFGRTPEFKLATPVAEVARAMGAKAFTITRPNQLLELGVQELLHVDVPVVLDVQIDPNERAPRMSRLGQLKDAVTASAFSGGRPAITRQ